MEPQTVNRLSDGLEIYWNDELVCFYPYKYLRLQCACANCVEELTGKKLLNVSEVSDDIIIVDFLIIGKYAIQFLWSDAHDTGIYPYSSLINFALNDEQAKCNNNKKLLEFAKSFAEEN